jgi:hypothetical protein
VEYKGKVEKDDIDALVAALNLAAASLISSGTQVRSSAAGAGLRPTGARGPRTTACEKIDIHCRSVGRIVGGGSRDELRGGGGPVWRCSTRLHRPGQRAAYRHHRACAAL